jgi:hypothetical protein
MRVLLFAYALSGLIGLGYQVFWRGNVVALGRAPSLSRS